MKATFGPLQVSDGTIALMEEPAMAPLPGLVRFCANRIGPLSLLDEGAQRPGMMVLNVRDRISGHAGQVRALDRFLTMPRASRTSGSPAWTR
jgi:hypothetical protein